MKTRKTRKPRTYKFYYRNLTDPRANKVVTQSADNAQHALTIAGDWITKNPGYQFDGWVVG